MVTFRMKVPSNPPRSLASRPCLPEGSDKSAAGISFSRASNAVADVKTSFVFNSFQHTNLQVVSFDIDTHYPGGGGGMSRFTPHRNHAFAPAKRTSVQSLCKSPLYSQQLANCFFNKSFSLIFIQTARGVGGV